MADVPAKETLAPNWNIAPTNDVWAVLERAPRGEEDTDAVQRELRPAAALRPGALVGE